MIPGIPQDTKERTIEIFAAFEVATNPALRQPCRDAMSRDTRAILVKTKNRKEF
jgi:hypothetical protein